METNDDEQEEIDGSILSIHVRNFFCHDNLEITFNKNVNFIVGRNGSGKSAILTALVVGLGGRAAVTNRGSNLHSFIKKGSNSAVIEIKIKNNSEKAYKQNIYGDSITIVRNILNSGTNYKIKSATGDVISTRLEELHAIITAHDIQVDNPISVLNQDEARSFHASDSKKKYLLFRKATNLDQTETNYVRAIENCEKAKSIWTRKREASLELEKELKKWETSYEQLQSRDEIELRQSKLQDEYYWSEIAEFEHEIALLQAQYDKHKTRIEKLVEKLNEMDKHFGSNSEHITSLKDKIIEKNQEKAGLEAELHELEKEVREMQSQLRSSQHATSKQKDLLNREKKKVYDLEKEIDNIQSGDSASRRNDLAKQAAKAEEMANTARARYDTAQNDAAQAQANYQRANVTSEQYTARIQQQKDTLKHLNMQLHELETRGNDASGLAVYGKNMIELCRLIKENKGQFSAPPRGPVGAYLKVKEKKWSGALEHIIGGSIQSFCVNSPEDTRKLFELMKIVYGTAPKPGVTCSKFLSNQHDVRRNKVRAGNYISALESLHIDDPVVANFLIDNNGVESILLVPDHDVAIRLSDNVENVPENCSKIVTLDSTEYHPAPNYRSYGGAGRPSRFLQVNTSERKTQLVNEIEELKMAISALEAKAAESVQDAEKAKLAERKAARVLQALLAERHNKDAAARAAKAALDSHHAPHHNVLVEELDISKEKLNTLTCELEKLTEKERSIKQTIDSYDEKIRKVKSKLSHASAACRALNDEVDQDQLQLDRGITARQTCAQKVSEDRIKSATIEKSLEEKRTLTEQKIKAALELCPRVQNPREKSVVVSELKKMQVKLNSMRSDGLTKQQVGEKVLELQKKYKNTKHLLDKLNYLIEEVKKTSDKHLNYCLRLQSYIAKRVQYCFQSILTLRGYSGRMDIDNARGVLEMWCTGRESSGKRVAATTSSLSGGERSYSTVAFIMALWECVELPFYFMDEFDVFMDNVNRKIVMELLIDHALRNANRQFVFLTPQDASSVTAGPHIKIHRMADPRRD